MSVQFRPEVYQKRKNSLWGKVLLRPSRFYDQCTVVIVSCTFLFFLLLVFGKYTTKETVQGLIEPQQGLVSLYAPGSATVEKVFVSQGSFVDSNDPLIKLDFHENLSDGQRYDDRLASELQDDRKRLEQQLEQIEKERQIQKEEAYYQQQIAVNQLDSLQKQMPLEEQSLETLRQQYSRLKKAYEKGSIAQFQLEQVERELALSEKNKIRLEQDLRQLQLQQEQFPNMLKQIENQFIERSLQIQQQIAQLNKNLIELQRRTQSLITAPVSGVVTQCDLKAGQSIRAMDHLIDLKKQGDLYWAKIYVPSQSIGFIKPGQPVSLRIHAYPHQHYGSLNGVIEKVTDSIYQGPGSQPGTALYIVYISLSSQTLSSDGRFPLKQGMQLDADIKTQEMTFFQKIFEPLLRLKK